MFRNLLKVGAIVAFVMACSGAVLADQAAAAKAPSITRTILRQQDLSVPGYAAAIVRVDVPVGAREGRHQHPGTLVALVEEGAFTLTYEGKPTLQLKPGDTFSVEPGQIHEGINNGTVPVKLTATFIFPKDKPMTIQVP